MRESRQLEKLQRGGVENGSFIFSVHVRIVQLQILNCWTDGLYKRLTDCTIIRVVTKRHRPPPLKELHLEKRCLIKLVRRLTDLYLCRHSPEAG